MNSIMILKTMISKLEIDFKHTDDYLHNLERKQDHMPKHGVSWTASVIKFQFMLVCKQNYLRVDCYLLSVSPICVYCVVNPWEGFNLN